MLTDESTLTPEVWVLVPDWTTPPLSLNDSVGHWAPRAKKIAACRTWAALAVLEALIPPLRHAVVQMFWTVPTKTHRDAENPVATLKPVCDGLVDGGIVPEDTPEWMTKFMPVIEYVKGQAGVRFEVSGVPK